LTTDKDFKRLVRDHARKTGESYSLARRRLLSKAGGIPLTPKVGELEQILVLSEDQARTLGHGFIGTEHILLGLIAEGQGAAAHTLAEFDISLVRVRSKIQEIINVTGVTGGGSLPQTPRTRKLIEYARLEVVQFGHISVGSGHLLLGLIKEGEGVAIRVLNDLSVDLEQLRAATLATMGVSDKTG
jgi:ATP-dependent Clp protease ATP-binding subunit ClpA